MWQLATSVLASCQKHGWIIRTWYSIWGGALLKLPGSSCSQSRLSLLTSASFQMLVDRTTIHPSFHSRFSASCDTVVTSFGRLEKLASKLGSCPGGFSFIQLYTSDTAEMATDRPVYKICGLNLCMSFQSRAGLVDSIQTTLWRGG